jgi:O-methyltransferase
MDIDLDILPLSLLSEAALRKLLALAADTPDGCFVEFGVYRGGAAWHLARLAAQQERALHLFDTFTGIPERSVHDLQHKIGDFGDTDVDAVMALIPSAIFHVGVFPQTMVETGPIAFVHVDCDQYVSCLAAIEQFVPRLVPGGIMLFDDYNATHGVTKAVNETFGERIHLTPDNKAYVQV